MRGGCPACGPNNEIPDFPRRPPHPSRHSDRAADWVLRRLDFPASYSESAADLQPPEVGGNGLRHPDRPGHDRRVPGDRAPARSHCRRGSDRLLPPRTSAGFTSSPGESPRPSTASSMKPERTSTRCKPCWHRRTSPMPWPTRFNSINEKLTALHLQKLALLFRHFEGINGRYSSLVSDVHPAGFLET